MKELIGLITVVLAFIGLVPYIIDIFRNKTKPHIFTWVVWAMVTLLAFFGQWQKGAGAGSWTTGVTGILTIFIAVISLKKGSKDITKSDVIVFIMALIAIVPWLLTKDPTLSVVILTIVNTLAFIPTIRKTIKAPESETFSSYVIHTFRHSLSIIALTNYNLATFLYPAVVALSNLTVVIVILKSRYSKNIGWKGDEPTDVVTKSFKEGIIKPGYRVLDVGCGFGRNANWLAKKGVNVTAVNIDEKEIKIAREKAEKMEINISYFHANATELEFPANSFDVVLDLGCSHMIPDREGQKKSEAEMARVLKPSGRLIYFGFSKAHPSYISKKSSPMFRNLEDIQAIYGNDFDILSHEETRWQPKPEERANFSEHVGLNIVLRRKGN